MRFLQIIGAILTSMVLLGSPMLSSAQSDTNVIRMDYQIRYQLEDSYSINYDNQTQPAKLKEFRVIFYDPEGQVLHKTNIETHGLTAKIVTYSIDAPVIGFSEIGLSVLSLHSGDIAAFPTSLRDILGLGLVSEVRAPEEEVDVEIAEDTPPPPPPPPQAPTLSAEDKARLNETAETLDALTSELNQKLDGFQQDVPTRRANLDRLDQLIQDAAALSERTDADAFDTLKPPISALSSALENAKSEAAFADTQSDLEIFKTRLQSLGSQLGDLINQSETEGADISGIMPALSDIETALAELDASISAATWPAGLPSDQLENWDAQIHTIQNQLDVPPPSSIWPLIIGLVLAILAALFWLAKLLLTGNTQARPLKSVLTNSQATGVVFPASPMMAGNVATPLSAAGQLTASQLQMLSGPYAHLRHAYQATGRIGYAQVGKPSAEDYSFGTGFLVTDRHVMTNRHVHGMYGHYMMDEADPGGIEFIAEKDKDASDFVPFNCEPPLLLPGFDIAIYTLARPVKNRKPIRLKSIAIERLEARDIIVIGYPDTHTPDDEDIKAVVEENAIFAVKRISQGQIFRHSTDTDTLFGVETSVDINKRDRFNMPAICHNASTLGGNSGSPLLDLKTGELVGVHFAGFKVFNKEEAANLAMAVGQLTMINKII